MQAVILAAGEGCRLGAGLGRQPKCLLSIGNMSLLQRRLLILEACGVHHIIIVTGYKAELVREHLRGLPAAAGRCTTAHNPRYQEGCTGSLLAGLEALNGAAGDVLLMDADVLHDRRLLAPLLVPGAASNRGLLDSGFDGSNEAVKLCLRHGRVVEFRKRPAPGLCFDQCGESVGFFRLDPAMGAALRERCRARLADGRGGEPYEEALREVLLKQTEGFSAADVRGLPWMEIDFPEDLRRAREEVLPQLLSPE